MTASVPDNGNFCVSVPAATIQDWIRHHVTLALRTGNGYSYGPVGEIISWAGPTTKPNPDDTTAMISNIPEGFVLCDGQALARDTYGDLYDMIGTLYGEGDKVSTFNVPDLRDRFILGQSDNNALGSFGGALTTVGHVLTEEQMPAHQHYCFSDVTDSAVGRGFPKNHYAVHYWNWVNHRHNYHIQNTASVADVGLTSPKGGNQAHSHEFLPPYYAMAYLIRT